MKFIHTVKILLISVLLSVSPVYAVSIVPDAILATSVSYTCTTSATIALASNSTRRSWLIVSPPTNTATVYIGFSTSLTTANGIPMNANNSLFDDTYVGRIYCIVASGTAPITVSETKRCPTPLTGTCS